MNNALALKKHPDYKTPEGPVFLIIMDGVGIGKNDETNAVYLAKTPILDSAFKSPFYTKLKAHGTAVGLPSDDDMGNSEVGHNALGAGRVFAQGAKLVDEDIENGSIFTSKAWQTIASRCKKTTLHFIGLLSDGNVHSHVKHLFAILDKAAASGLPSVRLHILLDGRDVPEKSALTYVNQLEQKLADLNNNFSVDYKIASGGGRMVTTMDRYFADWSVVKQGWDAHVLGKARAFSSATEAVETYYKEDPKITDQYLDPFVVAENGKPVGTIEDDDAVVFFNFRGDRAIEVSMAFEQEEFSYFDRERVPKVFYAGMMEYDGDLHIPNNYLVNPPQIERSIGEYLCANNVTSFAIAETQKFGHVTYFWNGNNSGYINEDLEEYAEIPSDRITFDKKPQMKAYEVTEKAIEFLKSGKYKFGRINLANGDMVGHTGVMDAAIKAVEVTDECVGKLIEEVKKLNGIVLITADHGNADEMFTEKKGVKSPKTAHTLNPVPFVIIDTQTPAYKLSDINNAGLSNVAATILNLLGYEKPADYDESLIEFVNPS